MPFTSIIFLFWFLPSVVVVHFFIPRPLRNLYLLLASLFFYAAAEGPYVTILLCTIICNWGMANLIGRAHEIRSRRSLFIAGLAGNLSLLIYFKYLNFIWRVLCDITLIPADALRSIHLPIGVSFFTFQAISYLFDVYRGDIMAESSPVRYGAYKAFFPQLIAGPIVRYKDVVSEVHSRRITRNDLTQGCIRFVIGLAKKTLIADTLARSVDVGSTLPADDVTFGAAWLTLSLFALQIYFDFSGYSDMAIGMGRIFGFHFKENFDFPYLACSVRDFWRRWHISLTSWFRDYVYIPMGGNRMSKSRTVINIMLVFILCGAWHGANETFVLWGLYHGFWVALEFTSIGGLLQRLPRPLSRVYAVSVVIVGWSLFRPDTLAGSATFLEAMLGLSSASGSPPWTELFNPEIATATLFALFLASGALQQAHWRLERLLIVAQPGRVLWSGARILGTVTVFYASLMAAGAASFKPFIYFRF